MTLNTTTPAAAHSPAFHSDDPPEVSEYRTMSALAIVGLVFGLASPLCFWAPLLMAIPAFGAAFSIVALRRIAASGGVLAGRGVALAGLVLCVASAAAALSHDRVTRHLRSNHAEEFARHWIGLLVAGKTEAAFGLTVEAHRPAGPPVPGEAPPTEPPLEVFQKHPLIKAVGGAGMDCEVHFEGMSSYSRVSSKQLIVQQNYAITPGAATDSEPAGPIRVILDLQRSRLAGENNLRWLVLSFRDADSPAEAAAGL